MSEPTSALGILPPGPWRLQPAFVRRQRLWSALIGVGAAVLVALLFVLAGDVAAILRDLEIHAGSNVRVDAQWGGIQMAGWKGLFPTSTAGEVAFTDTGGSSRYCRLELRTAVKFNVGRLQVFYDPADASRWTTNWSVEQAMNRWAACGQLLVVFGGCGGWLFWLGVRAVAQLRLARLVARQGVERLGVFELATATHRRGRLFATRYRVLVTGADGKERRITVSYPPQQGRPLFLPNRRVLLLVAEQGGMRAQVLRHDLWPLQLADDEIARAADILQRIDPTAGWRVTGGRGGLRLTCSMKHGPRVRRGT